MFKRFLQKLFGSGPSPAPPKTTLDTAAEFVISVPVTVQVPLLPETDFSQRARTAVLIELDRVRHITTRTIFHPQSDGTLLIFPPRGNQKETVN